MITLSTYFGFEEELSSPTGTWPVTAGDDIPEWTLLFSLLAGIILVEGVEHLGEWHETGEEQVLLAARVEDEDVDVEERDEEDDERNMSNNRLEGVGDESMVTPSS